MNLGQLNDFIRTFFLNIELTLRLFTDERVPLLLKFLFPIIYSIYLLCPIDLLPDFLPVIGQVDDLLLFIFFMLQFINASPKYVVDEHKANILSGEWRIQLFKRLTTGSDKENNL